MLTETEIKRLKQFENKHEGEDCILVANGPSLAKMDLSILKDYTVFGMNKIYLLFHQYDWRPDYLICQDEYVIEQSIEEFLKFENPIFLSDRRFNKIPKLYEKDNAFSFVIKDPRDPFVFQTDPYNFIFNGSTVTYAALQFIYWMGFQRVFIIGLDHRWKTMDREEFITISNQDDKDHFHPDYFKGKETPKVYPIHNDTGYFLANDFFNSQGRKIYDCTINGACLAFQKKSIEFLIENTLKRGSKSRINEKIIDDIAKKRVELWHAREEEIFKIIEQKNTEIAYLIKKSSLYESELNNFNKLRGNLIYKIYRKIKSL